jgi:lysophospholipase L1-like esterase
VALAVTALSALTSLFSSSPARSQTAPAVECAVPRDLIPNEALSHIASRVAHNQPVKIVAFGSSSTAGNGATTPTAAYPNQLQLALQEMFPDSEIAVVNKGVAGERVQQMMARFRRDVLDEHPDLLIWQTGTNSALAHGDLGDYVDGLAHGVDKARAAGIDVVLMTPQLSPRVEAAPQRDAYINYITRIASFRQVPVIQRYEMMKYWLDSNQMTEAEMISSDGLHQTDKSYHCLGVTAARVVAAGINRATTAGLVVADHQ